MVKPRLGSNERLIQLGDGRALGVAEYGDHAGFPIVNCHGGLICRRDVQSADAAARALGVRLISPDRPGVALSDPKPGRSLLGWPADVAELADQLEIERFAVMGWSLGGQYAAACGYLLPDRVSAVGIIAGVIPREWPGMIEEINSMDRRLMRLARRAPALERAVFRAMRLFASRAPAAQGRGAAKSMGGDSERAFEVQSPEQLSLAIAEGLGNTAGVVEEYRVFDAPWGFDPAAIRPPVSIWQGAEDQLVPPAWARRLADHIPASTLTIYDGEGHLAALPHWDEILASLLPTA